MKKLLLLLLCVPLIISSCKKENDSVDNPCTPMGNSSNIDFILTGDDIASGSASSQDLSQWWQYHVFSFTDSPFNLQGDWKTVSGSMNTIATYHYMTIKLNKSLNEIQDGEEFIFPSTGNEINLMWTGQIVPKIESQTKPYENVSSGTLIFSNDPCYYTGTFDCITETGRVLTGTFHAGDK